MKCGKTLRTNVLLITMVYSPLIFSQTASGGNSRFYPDNVKRVEGVIKVIRAFCDSIKPVNVSNSNIKYDQKYIRSTNELFNTITSDKVFAQTAKKNDLILTSSLNAGLIGFREYKFYPAKGYLAISILFSVIDDNIFYKKIVIESPLKRECANGQPVPFFDFLYLKDKILPVIDFPVKECTNCDSLKVDTLYQPVFDAMAKKYPAYQFVPNASNDYVKSLIFQHTYLQRSTYNNKVAPDGFVELIKMKEYDIIRSLLYSPNQLMAINAYETLVYLNNLGEPINTQDQAKMKDIVTSGTSIPVYCGRDCKPTNYAYNDLKVKKTDIVDKYQAALGQ
ncbi:MULTISPECIES: hypothetical protein [Niastella]|uniref:Uncharacterized protein n=1 Tax=Niastella soli TaxID=2821487 RepID=A0ABS3YSM5_9BACT|nr:hypothetical protein [Niastella soli]MBO9200916.1 hypothetical protein [Niastella soli]